MTSTGNASSQHELWINFENDAYPEGIQIGRTVTYQDPSGIPVGVQVLGYYRSDADYEFIQIMLVSYRPVGSTTCQWTYGPGRPMTIGVFDLESTVPAGFG